MFPALTLPTFVQLDHHNIKKIYIELQKFIAFAFHPTVLTYRNMNPCYPALPEKPRAFKKEARREGSEDFHASEPTEQSCIKVMAPRTSFGDKLSSG